MCKFFNSYEESLHLGVCKLAKYVRNCVVFWKKLHSWQKYYTNAGRDKFQIWKHQEILEGLEMLLSQHHKRPREPLNNWESHGKIQKNQALWLWLKFYYFAEAKMRALSLNITQHILFHASNTMLTCCSILHNLFHLVFLCNSISFILSYFSACPFPACLRPNSNNSLTIWTRQPCNTTNTVIPKLLFPF